MKIAKDNLERHEWFYCSIICIIRCSLTCKVGHNCFGGVDARRGTPERFRKTLQLFHCKQWLHLQQVSS